MILSACGLTCQSTNPIDCSVSQTAPVDWLSASTWMFAPVMVLDDRSARRPLVPLHAARGRGMDPHKAKAVRLAAWRGIPKPAWIHLGCMVVLEGFVVYLAAWGIHRNSVSKFAGPYDWIYPAIMIPLAVLVVASVWVGMRWKHAASLATEYIRAGICGSCGYALSGLTPGDDGCVVCPECGGAWRR